ncbi:DNA-binding NarL/FixJ family response regulator [Methylobacterium sp. BE186]|uniref:response regulator transcription factor n=1 Tax=Methylobacterium sp. BE186 TaxID=2817715 RepID=UPI00285BF8F3|nr:response regulator transcription factor [Methylobacterium sp. BE186]MDR7036620.1 DNA-binding NarL/FixJ family response regulator [Methylobacterium sp. BE186]
MTGVLIVDDHPIVLQGFRRMVEDAGVEMIFEASDPVSGYRLFHRIRPQVSVVDLAFRGSGLAGLSLIRRMRALEPQARILAFSASRDPVIVSRTLQSGATGYALKDMPAPAFIEAFEAVLGGRNYLPHALARDLALLDASRCRAPLSDLTAREIQILILLGEGKTYQGIADILTIGYRSVVSACATLRGKFRVSSQAELIGIALETILDLRRVGAQMMGDEGRRTARTLR